MSLGHQTGLQPVTQTSYPFWVAARARRKDASFSLLYPFLSRWREEGRAHAHGRTWEAGRQRKAEELARGSRGRRISRAASAAPAADGARARQGPRPAELARGGASLRGEGPEGPRQRGDASWWGGRVTNRAGGRALVAAPPAPPVPHAAPPSRRGGRRQPRARPRRHHHHRGAHPGPARPRRRAARPRAPRPPGRRRVTPASRLLQLGLHEHHQLARPVLRHAALRLPPPQGSSIRRRGYTGAPHSDRQSAGPLLSRHQRTGPAELARRPAELALRLSPRWRGGMG